MRDWSKRVTWANIPQLKLGNIRGYSQIFKTIWIINTIASIWLRKYARIFVLGHYLFLEAHSFPQALLLENCSLLRTDNVRAHVSEHIFAPNEGYCLFIHSSTHQTKKSPFKVSFLIYKMRFSVERATKPMRSVLQGNRNVYLSNFINFPVTEYPYDGKLREEC